jgi:hypothetical protein
VHAGEGSTLNTDSDEILRLFYFVNFCSGVNLNSVLGFNNDDGRYIYIQRNTKANGDELDDGWLQRQHERYHEGGTLECAISLDCDKEIWRQPPTFPATCTSVYFLQIAVNWHVKLYRILISLTIKVSKIIHAKHSLVKIDELTH